jgi:hypothetical protein
MTIYEKHISHVQAVNKAKTVEEHASLDLYLSAWVTGVRDAGGVISHISADMFYLDQGIDRPMCGGIWLDWTPEK